MGQIQMGCRYGRQQRQSNSKSHHVHGALTLADNFHDIRRRHPVYSVTMASEQGYAERRYSDLCDAMLAKHEDEHEGDTKSGG